MTRPRFLFCVILACTTILGWAQTPVEQFISKRLRVEADRRIFAVFVFLNLAGYDDENRAAGMHSVRRTIRVEANRRVPPALLSQIRGYYAAHLANTSPHTYSVV